MKAKKKIISRKHRVNGYNGCYYNIISLQSYERRLKAVRGAKEQKYWRDVTVKMMSDEERDGGSGFVIT